MRSIQFVFTGILLMAWPCFSLELHPAIARVLDGLSAENQALIRPFAEDVILPVVGDKIRYISVTPKPGHPQSFLMRVSIQNRTLAVYEISFKANPTPMLGLPEVSILRGPVATSSLELPMEYTAAMKAVVQGQFRSMIRADGLLHPHFPDLNGRIQLSPPQIAAVRNLWAMRVAQLADPKREGPILLGLVMPVAMGKTEVAIRYFLEVEKATQKKLQIIIIAQNTDQLDDLRKRFQARFQLDSREILTLYGTGASAAYNPKARLVLATRTTFHARKSELFKAGLASGPSALLIDEAHHTGLRDGEFDQILTDFEGRLKSTDDIFKMTATFWHENDSQIVRQLKGQVYGAFLTEREQAELRAARGLPELSRRALFRAIASGYLSPIHSYRLVNYLDSESGVNLESILKRSGLQKPEENLEQNAQTKILEREVTIHLPLVRHIARSIRESFLRGKLAAGSTGLGPITVFDRGIIFAPTQAHANFYAGLLNRQFNGQVEFRPYHSGAGVNASSLDWFRDENAHSERERLVETQKHKYLVVVNKLNEAIDIAKINTLYVLRNAYVYRNILQMLGRGERVFPFKPDLRVVDYGGSLEVLFQEFPVDQFPMAFIRKPKDTPVAQRSGVVIDGHTVDLTKFTQQQLMFLHQLSAHVGSDASDLAAVTAEIESSDPIVPPVAPSRRDPPPLQVPFSAPQFHEMPASRINFAVVERHGAYKGTADPESVYAQTAAFAAHLAEFDEPYAGQKIGVTPEDRAVLKTLDYLLSIARQFSLRSEYAESLESGIRWYFANPENLTELKTKDLPRLIWVLTSMDSNLFGEGFETILLGTASRKEWGGTSDRNSFEIDHKLAVHTAPDLYDLTHHLINGLKLKPEQGNALIRVVFLRAKMHQGSGVFADWKYLQSLVFAAAVMRSRHNMSYSDRENRWTSITIMIWKLVNEWFRTKGLITEDQVAFGDEHGDPVIPMEFGEFSVRVMSCMRNDGITTMGHFLRANMTERQLLRIPNFGRKSLNELREVFSGIAQFGEPIESGKISAWLTDYLKKLTDRGVVDEPDACKEALVDSAL